MTHPNPISTLTARLNWYQKAIGMKKGRFRSEDNFNWPDGTISSWRISANVLQKALGMLLAHDGKITVGQAYLSLDGAQINTALAIHDDYLLLEMRDAETGALSQYCVAYQPSFYMGRLIWQHGHYFMASEKYGDDPFQALCDAVEYMLGPKTVFLLMCDTTEGMFASVHHTYDEAVAALDKSFNSNDDMRYIADELGLTCTAQAYLENKEAFDEHGAEDHYWIEETTL